MPAATSAQDKQKHIELEEKINVLDSEISSIKDDVGTVRKDVALVQADVKSIANTQMQMQNSQRESLRELKDMLKQQNDAPPKFGMSMIVGFVSILGTGMIALWATINLLVSPIAKNLEQHQVTGHANTDKAIELLLERTTAAAIVAKDEREAAELKAKERHDRHQEEIETLYRLEELSIERTIAAARKEGEMSKMDEWLRDDTEAVKDDVILLRKEVTPAIDDLRKLQGVVEDLSKRVSDIDNNGSRFFNRMREAP